MSEETKPQTDLKSVFKQTEENAKYQALLIEIAKKLKPAHVRFANLVIAGKTPTDAYRAIKEGASDASAYNQGKKWMQNGTIQHYIAKAQEFAVISTMMKADYSEEDWLRTQVEILQKSMGEKQIKKVVTVDGQTYELDMHEDNLGQANKSQELLAKRFGWLTENQNVKMSGRTTLNMVRRDLTGAKPVTVAKIDKPEEANQ